MRFLPFSRLVASICLPACLLTTALANNPGGTNGSTVPVTLTDSGGNATMANGIVSIVCATSGAQINDINYTYNNGGGTTTQQLLNGGTDGGKLYWETGGFSSGTFTYTPVASGPDYAEMDCLSTSTTNGTMDVHFSMLQGSPGFYVTAIWSHRAVDTNMSMGETRDNIYAGSAFNWMCVDANRNKLMEVTPVEALVYPVFNAPVECWLWSNGIYAGKYEDKYKYSADLGVQRAWGWASVTASTGSGGLNVGLWNILSSVEYYNGGPMKRELMSHIGTTILNMTHGGHYGGGQDSSWTNGEVWTQCYGPWFIYCNNVTNKLTNPAQAAAALYADAQAQAAAEATAWPYTWFTNANYAPAANRGTIAGQIVINDIYHTNANASNLWVGAIQQPKTSAGVYDFQDWCKCYQFWVKSGSNGTFAISNVIAGANYTLYAFGPGAAGMFMSQNQTGGNPDLTFNLPATPFSVTVTGDATNNLGPVTWTPTRVGPTVFEIGYPNRTAEKKFRHGDDWWVGEYGPSSNYPSPIWSKYLGYQFEFPNGLNYVVGQSRWSTDWNFCQPATFNSNGGNSSSSSTITFNLAAAPASGANGSFYMATSSDFTGPIVVSVNGSNLGSTSGTTSTPNGNGSGGYNPNFDGGNDESDTTIREGIHGCYSDERITFPGTLLKAGQNTITIEMNGASAEDHIMYDYIRLELAGYIPPAPASVTVYPGNNCNLLSWPLVPGATSYNVLSSTTSGSGYAPIATDVIAPVCGSGSNNATYLDTNALNNTTYYYVVQSVNPVNASANSAQSAGAMPLGSIATTAPAAPTGLSVTVAHTNVTLSWSPSSGANYYSVWRSTLTDTGGGTSNFLSTNILVNTNTTATYTDTALTDGAYYSYFVTAANAAGTSPNSAWINATPLPAPPASAPAGFAVSSVETTTNQTATLTWDAVSGAVGYVIYRSTSPTGPFTFPNYYVMSIVETRYSDTVALGTYYYTVYAMNAGGVSAGTPVISTTGITVSTTTLALTAGANPSTYGASLTFQATITPTPPNGETVTFYSGTTSLGTAVTSGGVASLTINTLQASSTAQSIKATYAGDSSYSASTSAVLSETVNKAVLTYVADPASELVGTANPTFSGTVTGFVNGDTQASATTGAMAFTTTATSSSPAGSYPIDGSGLSANNYTFSQAAANATALTIGTSFTAPSSALALTAGASPCIYGTSLTFQATLSPPPGNGETVTFFSGANAIGSATLSSGVASLTLDNLPYSPSAQSITAVYFGDSQYADAISPALSQTVTQAALTYVANPVRRFVNTANPALSGTVTGFVNAETQATATTGTLVFTTTAVTGSPIGSYPIDGSGLSANNYTLSQAPGNATALTITVVSGTGSDTWSGAGADNNWQTQLNWALGSANLPPIPGDALFFSGTTRLNANNNYPVGTAFNGLTFNSGAGAFVLGGFSITNKGALTDNAASTETIDFPIALSTNQNISVLSGGAMTINGLISGSGFSLVKSGGGLLTLTGESAGASTYTGGNTINGGTLALDYSQGGSTPAANLVVGGALNLGGGALKIQGKSATANAQSFNTTTLNAGQNIITAVNGAGGGAMSVSLASLGNPPVGGVVEFIGPATATAATTASGQAGAGAGTATGIITTTSTGYSGGANSPLINTAAGTQYLAEYATVGLYDFAMVSGASPYTIIGASQGSGGSAGDGAYVIANGSLPAALALGTNYDILGNVTTSTTTYSYAGWRFNANAASTITIGQTDTANLLVTPNVGANNIVINAAINGGGYSGLAPGARSTSNPGSLVFWQNNTNGFLQINFHGLQDGKTAGGVFVQAGPGTVFYNGGQAQTGQTYLNGGVSLIATPSDLGTNTAGAAANLNGGAIVAGATLALDNAGAAPKRPIVLTNNGGGLGAVAGKTLTVDGVVSGTGPLTIGIPGSTTGHVPGTGAGTANLSELDATGTVVLSGTNTLTGSTTISTGTLALSGYGSLSNSSISIAGGATFDVSALASPYTMGGASFTASGDAAATIKGAAGGAVSLGTMPVILNLTSVSGATPNPALTISQGTLALNGNAFTINGPLLPPGTYTVIQQAGGNITDQTGTDTYPAPSGSAIGWPESAASISIQAGEVVLTISSPTACAAGNFSIASAFVDQYDEQLNFTNTNGIYSVAGFNMTNCAFTSGTAIAYGAIIPVGGATAYPIGPNAGPSGTGTPTVLPLGTTNLTLIAEETDQGAGASVNAVVTAAGCATNTAFFDPVGATLSLSQSGEVRFVFTNLTPDDIYVDLQNGTPGLGYALVVANGTVFALNGLTDGTNVASDIAGALDVGDTNTVVVEGFGAQGASAAVYIGEVSSGASSGDVQVTGATSSADTFINLPTLQITPPSGSQLVLSWPATGPLGEDFTGYSVQSSPNLAPGSWVAAGTAQESGGQISITITVSNSAQYYRLAQ